MRLAGCLIFLFCSLLCTSQHHYSAAPQQQLLLLNPAFAGSDRQWRIQSLGAVNDANTGFASQAMYLGADVRLGGMHGLGISFQSNRFSSLFLRQQYDVNYALQLGRKKFRLIPAIKLAYYAASFNVNNFSFGDMISYPSGFVWNTREGRPRELDTVRNFSISNGLLFYTARFHAAASLLDYASVPFTRFVGHELRQRVLLLQSGYAFTWKTHYNLHVYAFAKLQEPGINSYQYGAYLGCRFATLHLAHRVGNSLISGLSLSQWGLKIGYNNQYHYKPYYPAKFSHELFVSMNFSKLKKADRSSALDHPLIVPD